MTLIEYGDFECPYCGRAKDAIRATREHWGDRLRFVFRHFPLREVHPHAVSTAVVSESAADAGRFWEMHDILFDNQLALTDADLTEYGDRLGLQVWTDLDRHRERVQSDRDKGERAGRQRHPHLLHQWNPLRRPLRHRLPDSRDSHRPERAPCPLTGAGSVGGGRRVGACRGGGSIRRWGRCGSRTCGSGSTRSTSCGSMRTRTSMS
ncbi:DsbA family protein [Actinomadura madurae]|nr:DsbA family protein [Actinomadura madurae]